MRLLLLTCAFACGAASAQTAPALDADGWTVYSDISAWQASDAVPISQIDDDWNDYAPRKGRNLALMRNRAAIGVARRGWRLGVELRQDAILGTDRETLDAYHLYQHKGKPVPPVAFNLQADYFNWRAQALVVGYRFDGPRIAGRASSMELSVAAYGKQRLRERSVHGTLSYPRADTYGFAATHVDADDRMRYPFMGEAPSASGAGLSLAATVPLAPAWTLQVQADDIASRLRWKKLPVNAESLDSNVSSYDEDGYINYRPLLRGQRNQVERSFRIPRYSAATLDYRFQDWGASVQLARYAGTSIPTIGLSHRFGWLTLHGKLETRFDSAGIGIEAGNLRLQIQSDSVKLDRAKARALQLHYHRVF